MSLTPAEADGILGVLKTSVLGWIPWSAATRSSLRQRATAGESIAAPLLRPPVSARS